MIVLDASVVIAYLDGGDAFHGRAVEMMQAHADQSFAMSTLTVAEVLVSPMRAGRRSDVQSVLDSLGVQIVEVEADHGAQLAELRARTGLRMPDCCVLLAAKTVGGAVATFDDQLAKAAAQLV